MQIGLFVGKFVPPHIGHEWAIEKAADTVDKLILSVCDWPEYTAKLCKNAGWDIITLEDKIEWWTQELIGIPNIDIRGLDETGIPPMPYGWAEWTQRLRSVVPEKITTIFTSDQEYEKYYLQYFPGVNFILQDSGRSTVHISSTEIRADLNKNFDFIIPSAKPFFKKYLKNN